MRRSSKYRVRNEVQLQEPVVGSQSSDMGGQLLPPHSLLAGTHLELQDAGCRGPQGLYSLVGGQEKSVGAESIIRQVRKNQGDWSPD